MQLIDNIDSIISSGVEFLSDWVRVNKGFGLRSFYGETFSLLVIARVNKLDSELKDLLINSFERIDKTDPEFHWEFNNYAILELEELMGHSELSKYLVFPIFKGTKCANWSLLRLTTKYKLNPNEKIIKKAIKTVGRYQKKSGIIEDLKGVRSFQYHCFSTAMIGELYIQSKEPYLLKSFQKAISFIKNFVLTTGETLYIGRGQNQSFGYGVLVYILSLHLKIYDEKEDIAYIDKVIGYILKFRRENGSIPLMLTGIESDIIANNFFPKTPGWYPYNNYFDYFPFMLFFLQKALDILRCLDLKEEKSRFIINGYRDRDFIKVVNKNYEAIISRPGGYITNDMPIPYIISKYKNKTPSYGGEQFQKSIYTLQGIPLPYFPRLNKSIRWRAISVINKNSIWVISPFGIMKRSFIFYEDSIEVRTNVYSPFSFYHIYLLLDKDQDNIMSIEDLEFNGYEFSSSGRLKKYLSTKKYSVVRFNF